MRLLITGTCGFVGSGVAARLIAEHEGLEIIGLDNLSRPGSWMNWQPLEQRGVKVLHADLRVASDLENLGDFDWVIDAAATPSVLAGVEGGVSSRQLVEHNLLGTLNLLEWCRRSNAGLILLSSSRVYSIVDLAALPLVVDGSAFQLADSVAAPHVSGMGITEKFPTTAPISLYGASKLASEQLALEYAFAFGMPVRINRCGVLAGAGQFGKADQGIFAFWLTSYQQRRPLSYLGFNGKGYQVRDCLHPHDLADLIWLQFQSRDDAVKPTIVNVSGGAQSSRSLAELSAWCRQRWGDHPIEAKSVSRPYDLPWLILDNSLAKSAWNWKPNITTDVILSGIAEHAEQHPEWLGISSAL